MAREKAGARRDRLRSLPPISDAFPSSAPLYRRVIPLCLPYINSTPHNEISTELRRRE